MMKTIMNTMYMKAALLLPAAFALALPGCSEDTPETGREIAFRASVGGVRDAAETRRGLPEGRHAGTISLTSADGGVVIPVTVTETETQPAPSTRGGLVNGTDSGTGGTAPLSGFLDRFAAEAYSTDNRTPLFTPAIDTFRWNGTGWRAGSLYYWPQATGLDIYARANMPSEEYATVSVGTADRTQTLTYTVPHDTDDQTDILMAVHSGTGDNEGRADLTFRHPLAAVQFSRAGSMEVTGITEIVMSGVNHGGVVTQSMDDPSAFDWTVDDREATVSQDNDGRPFEVHGEIDGDPFLLVPQTSTGARSVVLTVTLIYNGHEIPLNAVISDMHWMAGRTYTFRIGYRGSLGFDVSMDEESPTRKGEAVISNTGATRCYVRAVVDGFVTDADGFIKRTYLGNEGNAEGVGAFTAADGTFGDGTWNTNWVMGGDGFYYYAKPLEVDNAEHTNPAARTTPLFNSYEFNGLSAYEQYEMNVSAQAIEWDADKASVTKHWGAEAAELLE